MRRFFSFSLSFSLFASLDKASDLFVSILCLCVGVIIFFISCCSKKRRGNSRKRGWVHEHMCVWMSECVSRGWVCGWLCRWAENLPVYGCIRSMCVYSCILYIYKYIFTYICTFIINIHVFLNISNSFIPCQTQHLLLNSLLPLHKKIHWNRVTLRTNHPHQQYFYCWMM